MCNILLFKYLIVSFIFIPADLKNNYIYYLPLCFKWWLVSNLSIKYSIHNGNKLYL